MSVTNILEYKKHKWGLEQDHGRFTWEQGEVIISSLYIYPKNLHEIICRKHEILKLKCF